MGGQVASEGAGDAPAGRVADVAQNAAMHVDEGRTCGAACGFGGKESATVWVAGAYRS